MKKIFACVFVGIFLLSFASASLVTDIISYWKLDRSSGSVLDELGITNGTNFGATRNQEGIINKSFRFDGTNDFVNISNTDSIYGGGNLSISAWINLTGTQSGGQSFIVDRRQGNADADSPFYFGYARGSNKVFMHTTSNVGGEVSAFSDADTITNNTWFHVVGTFNNETGDVKIYVNGILNDTTSGSTGGLVNPNAKGMLIGARADGSNFFNGWIDELGMWNSVLSQADVTSLYDSGAGNTYPFAEVYVTLNSPTLGQTVVSQEVNFNASLDPIGNTLTNATINVWYSNGTLFNETFQTITGTSVNDSIFNITGFPFASDFIWNVEGCVEKGASTFCEVADSNFTFSTLSVIVINNCIKCCISISQWHCC